MDTGCPMLLALGTDAAPDGLLSPSVPLCYQRLLLPTKGSEGLFALQSFLATLSNK